MKKIIKFTGALIIAVLLAGFFVFFDFDASEMKFVTVSDEEELVNALIDNFDTGYESVIIRTKGFKIDREKIASYISAEISNDAEDLCVMPASYTAGLFNVVDLWQFRLYFDDTKSRHNGKSELTDSLNKTLGNANAEEREGIAYSEEEIAAAQAKVSAELDRISAEIIAEAGSDEIQMHRLIFNYLCDHVEYDYTLSEAIVNGDWTNAIRKNRGSYGALAAGRTVCSGYAAAYKAICDRLGLDCWIAESEDHAWNLIRVDGFVYCVDVTSGDQDTWIADQFFMADPAEYETEYGYIISENCFVPERFRT